MEKLRARVPFVSVDRGALTGGAKWIAAREGFLTGADGRAGAMAGAGNHHIATNDPHRIVKSFLAEHAAVFGHDHTALDSARLTRDATAAHNGMRSFTWEQQLDGVPVHRGTLNAHLTRNGELIALGSEMMANLNAAAEGTQRGWLKQNERTPISGERALFLAAENVQVELEEAKISRLSEPVGAERIHKLAPGSGEPARLALIWLPMNAASVRLCWRVWWRESNHHIGYEWFVDAATGEVIWRRGVTESAADPATYRYYNTESPTPMSPGYATPLTNQPATVARVLSTITSMNATASPNGWVDVGENTLSGNNSYAYYMYATGPGSWSSHPVTGNPSRVFDFPLDLTLAPETHPEASAVNAFYWVNFAHDKLYAMGFDEANRNCQQTNFNRGGLEEDLVTIVASAPTSDDNAGMLTYPDGGDVRMELGIYSGPNPDREAALDAEIVIHEYCHAMSNRLIGDGSGIDEMQSRGMGEGWSDFFALSLTSASGDNLNGNYAKGAYASLRLWGSDYQANYYFGVRRYPYSTDLEKNPLTFKDIDPDQASEHTGIPMNPVLYGFSAAEVHMQGEVWCSALWECRAALITKLGFATGNQLMMQLVVDGLKLTPLNPTFIQARDAILQAEQADCSGTNKTVLWAAFAKRGLGVGATAPASSTTTGVVESFDSLDNLNITPGFGKQVAGPVGGPFKPGSATFMLTNQSGSSLNWAAYAEPPMELSSVGSALSAHTAQNVIASINAAAAGTLPAGGYAFSVFFTNTTSGAVFRRVFSFVVGISSPPVENFESSNDAGDLANRSLWFEPDATGTNYSVCRVVPSPAQFIVATSNAVTLDLTNAYAATILLTNGATFPYYNSNYSQVQFCRYGSIILGNNSTEFEAYGGYFGHFVVPRISAFRQGFYATGPARFSYQQLPDQLVATWENVKSTSAKEASFQLQMYFDGRIRLTFLAEEVVAGVCGLSPGGGTPPLFAETDLSASRSCSEPQLSLKLPPSVTEGGASGTGFVAYEGRALAGGITVNLTSSDTTEVTVPVSVTIPAGTNQTSFAITPANDAIRDGTQVAFITASRIGYTPATAPISIHDNETATISLSLPATRNENGSGVGVVNISAPAAGLVSVFLQSSQPEDLAVPPVVFIESGKTNTSFLFGTPDNNRIEGPQTVTVTASVQNWTPANANVTVLDNESTNLTMFTSLFQSESGGTVTNGSTVQISGVLTTNLLVFLISDDESEIKTPLFGGFIPAGSTNITFPLFMQDDAIVDGLVGVQLRALATGFAPATNFVLVFDNDGPPEPYNPQPPHLATNVSMTTDLSWGAAEGDLVVNGDFETGDFTGWTHVSSTAGGWVVNNGAYNPQSPDGALAPLAGSFSALTDQAGGGTHVLYQDFYLPDGATNLVLSWTDRIRNHGGPFSATHGFRVELRDTNDVVLSTLFTTSSNLPAFTGPTNRTANLMPWRGQWARVAFVEQDDGGYLNVHLDNIQMLAPSAAPTFFDLYFGTNPTPGAAERKGSTTNHSWSLATLLPETTYYWQLKTRRNNFTNDGPVWQFTTRGNQFFSLLVASNTTWRYLNTGVNPGSTWNDPGFSDAAWPVGTAKLGFGGDGENTVIGSANGITTFAFRKTFNVSHPEAIYGWEGRMIRDDGAAVYLNGALVWSDNLPGRFAWTDEALTALADPEEKQWITNDFTPSLIVTGQNLIAVEVHQNHPLIGFSTDLGFAFEFRAIYDNANHEPTVALTTPTNWLVFNLPGTLPLAATASDTDTFGNSIAVTRVEFFADDTKLGEDLTASYTLNWVNPPAGQHTLRAVVTDSGGLTATSAPVNVLITPPAGLNLATLIPPGAIWKYLDTGVAPAANWASPAFNDGGHGGWKSAKAQFGYGDGDETTVVNLGSHQLFHPITTWLRHHFSAATGTSNLVLRLLRDDGAVVYLNGTEIYRNNMSAGAVTDATLATNNVSGAAENAWLEIPLSNALVPPLFTAGDNVLAVEVHQYSVNSPDMSFDLELTGTGNQLPTVSLTNPLDQGSQLNPPNLPLAALANDPYGSVTNVMFFASGQLLGHDTTSPYNFTWNTPPPGLHTLTAVAVDNYGASRTSAPVAFTVLTNVTLSVRPVGAQWELFWPTNAPGYALVTASNLTLPAIWTLATNPVVISNGAFRAAVDADRPQQFFRLRAP